MASRAAALRCLLPSCQPPCLGQSSAQQRSSRLDIGASPCLAQAQEQQ